jgi:hypothetical protein
VRLYPDVPARRRSAILRDVATVLALALFVWLGVKVHDAVDEVASLGRGVREAGTAVQRGFGSAADAVDDAPLVGGTIAGGLRSAGRESGGNVAEAGRKGEESVHHMANVLGAVIWLVPTLMLLWRVLPARVTEVRRLNEAAQVLRDPDAPERQRLLAMRAAFGLPYGALLAHTRDPLGDLAAERYDALVAAALEDAGLRAG